MIFAGARSRARKVELILFSVALLLAGATGTGRGQSALDGFDPSANGIVRVVVIQPDGKILLGGDFTTLAPNGGAAVTRNRIARLNPDGTLDTAFNPNADNVVFAIALQPDGKVLVGGLFGTIGGAARGRMARLDATSGLADSFDPNANGSVFAIAVQADGKILAGGQFNGANSIGGQPRNYIARLDAASGSADSFDPNANAAVRAIAVQADGKILAGGDFNQAFGAITIGGQTRNCIARLDVTTGLADSFNPNANEAVLAIAVQADGKILAGGAFAFGPSPIGGQPREYLARLDPITGQADSFNPSASGVVNAIVVQPDGRILVGGSFTSMGGEPRNFIGRLNPATGLADSFNPNANNAVVNAIAVQPDGKILAGGDFTTLTPNGGVDAVPRNRIARLEIDGRLDRTLNLSILGSGVSATAVQPDGKILIGGRFTSVLGTPRNLIARLNTDGTLDTAFDPNAAGPAPLVQIIALQADGKILIGGQFETLAPNGGAVVTRNNMARLNPDGTLDNAFNPNANGSVYAIVVQADGKILAGGQFNGANSIGGKMRNRVARLDATTGLADSFDPNAKGFVGSIAVQADGKILVGGQFFGANSIGGQTRNYLARLDATTGLADSFNPNANSAVTLIAIQVDGQILVGGAFNGANSIGGQSRNRIARLDATSGLADSFDPDAKSPIGSIAVQADGKILVGGEFHGANSIGGQTCNYLARLDPTTGLADSVAPSANGFVNSIAVLADGKVLVGGQFTEIGGQTRNLFARLTNDTIARNDLAVTQTAVTWTRSGSSPQFTRVTFEDSTNGVNYNFLGNGIPQSGSSNWILTGLNLSIGQNLYIRAQGYYRTGNDNGSDSTQESVRNAFLTAAPTTLANISTRLRVETGDSVLIGGFIVTGTQDKKVIVRAIGPSLPLADKLVNPTLELRNSAGALLDSNDDWVNSPDKQAILDSTIPPSNDLESAIVATLPAHNASYTAIVRGLNNTTGIGVVEVYDLDRSVDSKLANIATRGLVQTGDTVLIAGTIVLGQSSQKVIVRAIGPSLSIAGRLLDPTLELRDANGGVIRANDNWRTGGQETEIIQSTVPPTNDFESALVETLPGNGASYTAIVRGVNDTTGIAVVEVYALN